jgi:hypothetical protein
MRSPRSWLQPVQDSDLKRRNEDRTYALVFSNIVFLVIVIFCFKAKLQSDIGYYAHRVHIQNGISSHVAGTFYWLQGSAIMVYIANEFLPRKLVGTHIFRFLGKTKPAPTVVKGFSIPLGITVLLNAYAIWYLTYKTGGPSNSPYAQVLVAMLIIAEQTKVVAYTAHGGSPADHDGPFGILYASIKEFRNFLAVAALFYIFLLYFQWHHPVHVTHAPAGLTVGVTALLFLVSTVTNFLSGSGRSE